MEGNANPYNTNEVSDDEEEDFMDLVSPYKPLYAANSHNVGRNTRGAARQLVQQHQQQPIPGTTQPPNPREPPAQLQQQPSPTAPAGVNSDVCVAIISHGPNKGNVYGNRSATRRHRVRLYVWGPGMKKPTMTRKMSWEVVWTNYRLLARSLL